MYIPIGTIIFFALIAYVIYAMRKENEKTDKKYEKEEKHREIQRHIKMHEEKIRKEKEENEINFILETLKIDYSTAKEVYSFLIRNDKLEIFLYSENKKNRIKFYNKFLQEKNEIEEFSELIKPVITKEQLDLNICNLFFNYKQELLTIHTDIPLNEKLKQINSNECFNTLLLSNIIKPYYPNFEYSHYVSIRKIKSDIHIADRLEILLDDVYKIIEIFNNHFNFSITNVNEICLNDFSFFIDKNIYKEWHYILEEIFLVCLFESHILPENTKLENISGYEYEFAFNTYCRNLFFYKPYYSITDCKQALLKHVEELKSEQKYLIESR